MEGSLKENSDIWFTEDFVKQLPELCTPNQPKYVGGVELLRDLDRNVQLTTLTTAQLAHPINSNANIFNNTQPSISNRQLPTLQMHCTSLDDSTPITLVSIDEADMQKYPTNQLLLDNFPKELSISVAKEDAFTMSPEEMELLEFLESKAVVKQTAVENSTPIFSCNTTCPVCGESVDLSSFTSHICKAIKDDNVNSTSKIPMHQNQYGGIESMYSSEPNAKRVIEENLIRIRRLLRDDYKYVLKFIKQKKSIQEKEDKNGDINPKRLVGPHMCTLCGRKFVHASGLLRHVEKHAMDLIPNNTITKPGDVPQQNPEDLRTVIKCTFCGRVFLTAREANDHLPIHFSIDGNDEREQDPCMTVSYEKYLDFFIDYLNHELRVNKEGSLNGSANASKQTYLKVTILSCVLQCEFCDFIFTDVHFLLHHSSKHPPERIFECFSCEISFENSKEAIFHKTMECINVRENSKVYDAKIKRFYICNVCENKFNSLDMLIDHRYNALHFFPRISTFKNTLSLGCENCPNIAVNTEQSIEHYQQKHFKKPKREVNQPSTKTRQYLCDICGKSYTQSSHLWQHLRFHQGVKPFACTEPGCARKFTIRPDLNDHIRKCHTGERPYHCLVCGKRFLTGSVFYQHRLIHRGERRYECEDCGKRFYRADALKNHQRIHTGEKPFDCLYCTKNFRQRGDRDKHIRARHAHLDEDTRLMMQMQKIQLEQAEKVKRSYQKKSLVKNIATDNENFEQRYDPNDVVIVGNVPFPKSMFETIMPDIDGGNCESN